jgi:hypothetical protein
MPYMPATVATADCITPEAAGEAATGSHEVQE